MVHIRGGGLAALVCERLLGLSASSEPSSRLPLPAIVTSDLTRMMICDALGEPNLFAGFPRIDRRIVLWGQSPEPVDLPHSATIVSERVLFERLNLRRNRASSANPALASWTIYCGKPLPIAGVDEFAFGDRTAAAVAVECASQTACYVESVRDGWLFLIPGYLIAAGDDNNDWRDLLRQSRLVAPQIRTTGDVLGRYACHPRISAPLATENWLLCGSAAMTFDPLCGDGAGNAVREAILASAIARSSAAESRAELAAHYRTRLMAGCKRHLDACHGFYAGVEGPWWVEQRQGIEAGLAWCAQHLPPAPNFQFRLNGFHLERVASDINYGA